MHGRRHGFQSCWKLRHQLFRVEFAKLRDHVCAGSADGHQGAPDRHRKQCHEDSQRRESDIRMDHQRIRERREFQCLHRDAHMHERRNDDQPGRQLLHQLLGRECRELHVQVCSGDAQDCLRAECWPRDSAPDQCRRDECVQAGPHDSNKVLSAAFLIPNLGCQPVSTWEQLEEH